MTNAYPHRGTKVDNVGETPLFGDRCRWEVVGAMTVLAGRGVAGGGRS